MIKLEREKAAAEADRMALGQRLEQEWEAREAAEAAAHDAAAAVAHAAAHERDALQEGLDKVSTQRLLLFTTPHMIPSDNRRTGRGRPSPP